MSQASFPPFSFHFMDLGVRGAILQFWAGGEHVTMGRGGDTQHKRQSEITRSRLYLVSLLMTYDIQIIGDDIQVIYAMTFKS
jgi:hypothetical protein